MPMLLACFTMCVPTNSHSLVPRVIASTQCGSVVVVDKPHGCSLEHAALAIPPGPGAGGRAGAFCHNLDLPTSGCLVGATTAEAASRVGVLWQGGRVSKVYVALVEGWPDDPAWRGPPAAPGLGSEVVVDEGALLDFRILTSQRRSIQKVKSNGKRALTRVRLAARGQLGGEKVALVWCWPVTGRRHQLRVHLGHVGFPIVGDVKYGAGAGVLPDIVDDASGDEDDDECDGAGSARVFLHAASVTLPLPAALGGQLSAIARLDAERWHPARAMLIERAAGSDALSAIASPPASWFAEAAAALAEEGVAAALSSAELAERVRTLTFDPELFA
jgi:23S rRNA-/tRNA-specific pseudouridylate synthase